MSIGFLLFLIIWLVLLGFVFLGGRWAKVPAYERPLVYSSKYIMALLNLLFIVWLIASGIFVFIDWKIFLLFLLMGIFLGNYVLVPVAEKILEVTIVKPIQRRIDQEDRKNDSQSKRK